MNKHVRTIIVDGQPVSLTVEVKNETIVSTMSFLFNGKETSSSRISARKRPSGIRVLTIDKVSASELLKMWGLHSQEHQAIVEEVRSADERYQG
ncbi:Uncharacterised protein [Serratia quinivorans]|nr:Uncharacterised protein [Serratia quinivorans]